MKRVKMRDDASERKRGSRAIPGRKTRRAKRWNHLRIHREEGLREGGREGGLGDLQQHSVDSLLAGLQGS